MDLRDIAARELNQGLIPLIGRVGSDQNLDPGSSGLGEGIREVRDLISGYLPTVGIWKMAIGHQHGHFAEIRLDPNPPISVRWSPDLDAGRMRVIGDNFAVRKARKPRMNADTLSVDT